MPPIAMKYGQKNSQTGEKNHFGTEPKKICPKIALPLNVGFPMILGM